MLVDFFADFGVKNWNFGKKNRVLFKGAVAAPRMDPNCRQFPKGVQWGLVEALNGAHGPF